ncbi:MAG: glycoside hydrolase family 28 protein [Mangrovibacterium sp.]
MKRISYLLFILLAFAACSLPQQKGVKIKEIAVKAPFDMPAIKYPDFKDAPRFIITDFGAKQGDKDATATAINNAVTAANKVGGGTVVIPKGEWLTKTLHYKSNVNIYVSKGAKLLFSGNPEDYLPAVHTTWEGMECYNYSPLIYAYECNNVALTGQGTVEAIMDVWKTWFPRPHGHMNSLKELYMKASYNKPMEERYMVNDSANFRPHFIQFNRCNNVLIDSIHVRNSPFWTIHPYLCKDVLIQNIDVYAHGHNTDGIDPEMTQNIIIQNCVLDQGDDAIAIKAGRNQDAWRLDTPTKNLVIQDVLVKNGHQLIAIGSELSGGIENVYVTNCKLTEECNLFHLLFIKTNERRGGYVKNIYMKNIKADHMRNGILGIETNVLYQWKDLVPTIERRLTNISDIHLENFDANELQFIANIQGEKDTPIRNVSLKNIHTKNIITDNPYRISNVENFSHD